MTIRAIELAGVSRKFAVNFSISEADLQRRLGQFCQREADLSRLSDDIDIGRCLDRPEPSDKVRWFLADLVGLCRMHDVYVMHFAGLEVHDIGDNDERENPLGFQFITDYTKKSPAGIPLWDVEMEILFRRMTIGLEGEIWE